MSDDRGREGPEGTGSHGARQAPNVKPKRTLTDGNSKEERRRRERPEKVRRSRSTDSARDDRGRRREQDRHHGQRRQRGRSEEARRRDRKDGSSDRRRVKPPQDEVEDTECAVCFCKYDNVFRTPKLLACGHTFCLECLARINVTSLEIKTLTCPICRELTDLPHGQDLPRLGNNEDIIGKLPPDMQRVLSVRFQRSKGRLLLKSPNKTNILSLPKKSQEAPGATGDPLSAAEQGMAPATVVEVGRPPNRVRGHIRRFFRSDQCYYAVVGTIIAVAVALILVGILAFVIIPNVSNRRPPPPGNQTVIVGPASQGSRP